MSPGFRGFEISYLLQTGVKQKALMMQRTLFIFLKIWVSNLTRKISLTLDVFRRFTYLVSRDNKPQHLRKDLKMLAPSESNTLKKKFWTNTKLGGVISARLKTCWLEVISTETYHQWSLIFISFSYFVVLVG